MPRPSALLQMSQHPRILALAARRWTRSAASPRGCRPEPSWRSGPACFYSAAGRTRTAAWNGGWAGLGLGLDAS